MLNPSVAFRVDASTRIGTGHVIRCITLAEELRRGRGGARVVFVCRDHPGHLAEMIASRGFEVVMLDAHWPAGWQPLDGPDIGDQPPHIGWLGADQADDARGTLNALKSAASWDWLVVDHYALDYRWETAMRQVAQNIMVIDDLADRAHDCDLLLDQNCFGESRGRYAMLVPGHCRLYLGPRFALLRPGFREARAFTRMRGNGVARVLVYFGGADTENATGKALEALSAPGLRHLYVDVVAGPAYPHLEALTVRAGRRPGTRVHVQPEGFVELVLRADLCVGACGSSIWERFCLGLPSVAIPVAKNQLTACRILANEGLIFYPSPLSDRTPREIIEIMRLLPGRQQDLDRISAAGKAMVDGLGVLRVCEAITGNRNRESVPYAPKEN